MNQETTNTTPHNLGLYRLDGFSGRRPQLLQLHDWMTGGDDLPAIAISGERGSGKSTLATAAAWNHYHHFTDGIVRVGAAGRTPLRLYDIVRTMDTVFGTTLTRISEERWGISILEQLYRRRRLLFIDELSGMPPEELSTLVNIISHLNEAEGQSRIMLIDRDFSPAIAELVQDQFLNLTGLVLPSVQEFIRQRAPDTVKADALACAAELTDFTDGQPFLLRLMLGLMLDYSWDELSSMLRDIARDDEGDVAGNDAGNGGTIPVRSIVAFAVENLALIQPEVGPFLTRLVSAAGGAGINALRQLFWQDLGAPEQLDEILESLLTRGLLDLDKYAQRVVMHPIVRDYLDQNAVMLGEEWDRRHAQYYVHLVETYADLTLDRWPEIDVEWGNIVQGADWCVAHLQRLWAQDPRELIRDARVDEQGLPLPTEDDVLQGAVLDALKLARSYALAISFYAFWRHPPATIKWLAAGAVAALVMNDYRNYGWLQTNIGRQLFFMNEVESAIAWLTRAKDIFDVRDLLAELAYVYTDLGTSLRILDKPRQAVEYYWAVLNCIVQIGDPKGLATAYMNMGSAYYSLDSYERALQNHRLAIRVAMRENDGHALASAYNNMGLAMEGLDRFDDARQSYKLALQEFQRIGDETGISTCYNNLGSVSYALDEHAQALQWYEEDLALSAKRGTWTDMAATLHNLGHVALELDDLEQATAYFAHSRDLYAAFELAEYVAEEEEMIAYIQEQSE